jgi:thiamine-phosphate pyrophosphorylase
MERTRALQIIEANLNRLREGIRVAEDILRYSPDAAQLFNRAKVLRLDAGALEKELRASLGRELARARRLDLDAGKETAPKAEMTRGGEASLISANLKRAQEAARTLEELTKTLNLRGFSQRYKKLRFAVYTLETGALAFLETQARRKRFSEALDAFPLYLIIDELNTQRLAPMQLALRFYRAGGRVIQLRFKVATASIILREAAHLAARFPEALLIINDRVDIARAADAFGVHVGPQDIPLSKVASLRGDLLVGYSARTPETASRGVDAGADYIGVGAVFPTSTKSRTRVAIGGVTAENFASTLKAGAAAAAVISAVADPRGADEMYALAKKLKR